MVQWLDSSESPVGPELFRGWAALLQSGGTFLYPSDTIYGLGCDASQISAVERVRDAKDRVPEKSFLVLLGSFAVLEQYFLPSERERAMLARIWPGPFTCLLEPKKGMLEHLRGPDGRIGVRWGLSPLLDGLFQVYSGLLLSTSANRSGDAYHHDSQRVLDLFKDRVDAMILLEQYPLSKPSALVACGTGGWSVLREGPFPLPEDV